MKIHKNELFGNVLAESPAIIFATECLSRASSLSDSNRTMADTESLLSVRLNYSYSVRAKSIIIMILLGK